MVSTGLEGVLNSTADRSGIATGGWAVAGIPVVATFAQAIFALVGIAPSARSQAFASFVDTVDILYEAALLFKSRSVIVIALFTLIGIAWLVQGGGMFVLGDKGVTLLAAGLGGVLYFVLFFGVYLPLFDRGLPVLELGGFFAIPFVATGAVLGSAVLYPWGVELEEETKKSLQSIDSDIEDKRQAFEDQLRDFAQNFEAPEFERLAPQAVANAKERYRAAIETYEDLAAELDRLRESDDTPTERRAKAGEIEEQVKTLTPEERAATIESEFRSTLAATLRNEYADPPDGYPHDVANMQREYVEMEVPGIGDEIRVRSLGSALGNALEGTERDPVSLEVFRDAIQTVETNLDSLRKKLDAETQAVKKRLEDTNEEYAAVKERIDHFPPAVATKVREIAIENRGDDLVGYKRGHGEESIKEYEREARKKLRECAFDDAKQAAAEAANAADELSTFVEYIEHVERGVNAGDEYIRIPSDIEVTNDLREVCNRIGAEAGVGLTVGNDRISITADSPPREGSGNAPIPEGESAKTGNSTGGDSDEGRSRSRRDIVDPVCMVYQEAIRRGEDTDGNTVGCLIDDLPRMAREEDVLTHAVQFAAEQSEIVDETALTREGDTGQVDFIIADDQDPKLALEDLETRYRDLYG